ncbi:MAG: ABC transporter ATP-binding protein [Aristaeellaceae bacterium]
MTDAITVQGLCKQYSQFSLRDVTFSLPAGCIMGLVGENGAGKSTLIRLIMNATRADAGRVAVLGKDNQSPDFQAVKEDVGVVLDEAFFPEVLNPTDIGKVMALTYRRWDVAQYARYLEQFSLPARQPFKEFSRGMKMKLAIAVALSHAPRLLLLDEATSGLDPLVRDEILEVFLDFARAEDHAVLLSSHIVSDLEKICDYIAYLHKGQLLLCQEKDRLLEEYAVARLTREQLALLPEGALLGLRETPYFAEALVKREQLPPSIRPEHATLEEILLLLVKGVN